jgi:hypothetical protein
MDLDWDTSFSFFFSLQWVLNELLWRRDRELCVWIK